MSNDNPTKDSQRITSSNNYASRLLNRVLTDRSKAGKITPADAAKFANEVEERELVASK